MIQILQSDTVDAWVYRDPTVIERSPLSSASSLSGIWFGVKDVIDVAAMPTAYGVDFATRQAECDAWSVAMLRAVGAIPIGKTHTTPFAYRDPSVTRNPKDFSKTPGGSSSGSAAAVAAGHVPFALGTQSFASTLRPAAYCGVVGYKPTWGEIPMQGIAPLSPSTDSLGILACDAATARLVAEALMTLDKTEVKSPVLGLAIDYMSPIIEDATRANISRAISLFEKSGIDIRPVQLPECVESAIGPLSVLHSFEAFVTLGRWLKNKPTPPNLTELLLKGKNIDVETYRTVRDWREEQRNRIDEIFCSIDALILPCANTPPGRATIGDGRPCGPWTFFGLPTIALPIANGVEPMLPLAIQLVARSNADGQLLQVAQTLEGILKDHVPLLK